MPIEEVYSTAPPAKPEGSAVTIYSNPICPFAQRTRIIAAHLKVPHNVVDVHLQRKPEWFVKEINPYGQVPVVEHDGHLIRESAINFEYLIDVFGGGNTLWPTDPYKKAQGKLLFDGFGSRFIPNYYKNYRGTANEESNSTLLKVIGEIEALITSNGGQFVLGPEVGAVDFLIWPWLERLEPAMVAFPALGSLISKDKQAVLFGWLERMKKVDAIKQTYLAPDNHLAFLKSVKAGVHDYSAADVEGKGIKIHSSKPN